MQPLTTTNQHAKMETEITDKPNTPASGLHEPTCSPSSRALVCCFCGRAWSYDGTAPKEPLLKEAYDHEAVCEKNPYKARIHQLECGLRDISIWAENDPAHFSNRAEAMKRIARRALHCLENDRVEAPAVGSSNSTWCVIAGCLAWLVLLRDSLL